MAYACPEENRYYNRSSVKRIKPLLALKLDEQKKARTFLEALRTHASDLKDKK